jgi:secreted PhoX family phosphatase
MLRGDTAATSNGWSTTPIFTVGETVGAQLPPGLLDGIGAFPVQPDIAAILVNHEFGDVAGYPYRLKNGTRLTGARITSFVVGRTVDALGQESVKLHRAGPAYDTVYDRSFAVVTTASQINEDGAATDGFDRFCSSLSVRKGTYGFADDVYLTGEETGVPFHPHGGSIWALDVAARQLWAVPALGRGAWENVTPLSTGAADTVALLMGDDTAGSPLYLYVGVKNALGDGSFLDRNGLLVGKLYGWKADGGDVSPETFHGLNSARSGSFVEVAVQEPLLAGMPGHDAAGYLDSDTLAAQADALGCFSFSRPEDLATNPLDGTQAVFASTGRGQLYPADNWGTLYVVDVDFGKLSGELVIVHDADGLAVPDEGIRNPDNVCWAGNGKIYAQEDRSTFPGSLFGAATGIEASVWQLDPVTRAFERVAEIDRIAVVPSGTTDGAAGEIGNWESSGVLDVTDLFGTAPGERLLIVDVQAHGIKDGPIGGSSLLDEGGQLLSLSKK